MAEPFLTDEITEIKVTKEFAAEWLQGESFLRERLRKVRELKLDDQVMGHYIVRAVSAGIDREGVTYCRAVIRLVLL